MNYKKTSLVAGVAALALSVFAWQQCKNEQKQKEQIINNSSREVADALAWCDPDPSTLGAVSGDMNGVNYTLNYVAGKNWSILMNEGMWAIKIYPVYWVTVNETGRQIGLALGIAQYFQKHKDELRIVALNPTGSY